MAEQPQGRSGMLSTLPNITTTISSILTSPVQTEDKEKSTLAANDRSLTSPLSAYLPTTGLSWFRRQSVGKTTSKSAGNSPRTPGATADMGLSSLNEVVAEDTVSRISSESDSNKKRKRAPRPKTCYSICHAPPRHSRHHKIQVRARPLLQLHKLESRSRPRPAYELLPSSIFSARLIKAIAKFSGSKHGLNPNDLAIVRAERYHAHELSPIEEDESRDILALICGLGKGHTASTQAKVCLEDGIEWDASQLATGSYEFSTVDDHGLRRTVRWVPKRGSKAGIMSPTSILSPISPMDNGTPSAERKFNFSTISANTRRHPIIAHLTSTSLEVSDTYTLPTPNASVDLTVEEAVSEAETLTTTDDLRSLISATAIYVALLEGWCTHQHRADDSSSFSLQRSSSTKSNSPTKSRPESLDTSDTAVRRSSSLRQVLRSPTLQKRPSSSSSSLALPQPAAMPGIPEAESPAASRRKRADTTSTVIVTGGGIKGWRPEFEDETDDEEEPTDVTNDNEQGEKRGSSSSERRRNFSESTFGGSETSKGSEATVDKEKRAAQNECKKEKKKGLLSKLLCGMV